MTRRLRDYCDFDFCRGAAEKRCDLLLNPRALRNHMAEVSIVVPAWNRFEPAVTDRKLLGYSMNGFGKFRAEYNERES